MSEYQDRQERLTDFFQSKPREWDDLKAEMNICLGRYYAKLASQGRTDRDFFAGMCAGVLDVISFEETYNEAKPKGAEDGTKQGT